MQIETTRLQTENMAAANSTYKKLAVQWLNETLCFASSVVLADSFVLRNPLLRQAPKRYCQSSIKLERNLLLLLTLWILNIIQKMAKYRIR